MHSKTNPTDNAPAKIARLDKSRPVEDKAIKAATKIPTYPNPESNAPLPPASNLVAGRTLSLIILKQLSKIVTNKEYN